MSTSTDQVVAAQIHAMGTPLFEVGIHKQHPATGESAMLPRTWDAATLLRSVGWLRLQNKMDRNIFVRPGGLHPLTLLDDLKEDTVEHMKVVGFNPAVIVETSPRNFQAWLNHGSTLSKEMSTLAAQVLAERFSGDPSSADWRHFGRLAGFTNRKDKYQTEEGLFPFVKLVENTGAIYPNAPRFLAELRLAFEKQQDQLRQAVSLPRTQRAGSALQSITVFRQKPAYKGDGNRIDLAYAIYALAHDVSEAEISAAIASRDLSHKGDAKRQADYIDRTIEKARQTVHSHAR